MRNDLPREVDAWGRAVFHGQDAVELLLQGHDIADLLIVPDEAVIRYNQLCEARDKQAHCIAPIPLPTLTPEQEDARRVATWLLPEQYQNLPVRDELLARCQRSDEIERVHMEMDMFEARGWLPVLRLMFYLVAEFRAKKVVWGVGRGSSVASYCLYLIGVHRVDSLAYELSINEFLK